MNTKGNIRTPRDIDDMTLDEINAMPLEEIKALYDTVLDNLLNAQMRKKKIIHAMTERIDAAPIGTTKAGGVKISTPKSVKWDMQGLDALRKQIVAEGGTPAKYITEVRSLKVSEEAYKEWKDAIKDRFTPLRTVKPGASKLEFYDDV